MREHGPRANEILDNVVRCLEHNLNSPTIGEFAARVLLIADGNRNERPDPTCTWCGAAASGENGAGEFACSTHGGPQR